MLLIKRGDKQIVSLTPILKNKFLNQLRACKQSGGIGRYKRKGDYTAVPRNLFPLQNCHPERM